MRGTLWTNRERDVSADAYDSMSALADLDALETCITNSDRCPQFIFKHSPSCGISYHAKAQVETMLPTLGSLSIPCHLIDVVNQRGLSQDAARRLGVSHQSPQLILLRGGEAIWKASHGAISRKAIEHVVEEHLG